MNRALLTSIVMIPTFVGCVSDADAARGPDFNGDGYTDFATSLTGEVNDVFLAGAVHVIYGSPTGLSGTNDRVFHQDKPGMPSLVEQLDQFGHSITWGDFNDDGYDDLAVAVPGEDSVSQVIIAPGAVHILYGSEEGLLATGGEFWKPQSFPPSAFGETSLFGVSAAGDFDGDGIDDLVLQIRKPNASALRIVFGRSGEIDPENSQVFIIDAIWHAMTSADFNGDEFDDLVIGSGDSITIILGSPEGLTVEGMQTWSQNSPGIESADEPRDRFGSSVAAGDFNKDGFDDLAGGGGNAYANGLRHAGAVRILYGSAAGLTAQGTQRWHLGKSGVIGTLKAGDYFGAAVTVGDFDDDGWDDLAIGAPNKNVDVADSGAASVLYGSNSGLTAAVNQYWHEDSSGILGDTNQYDNFGDSLTSGDFNGDGVDDLLVAAPQEFVGVYAAGAVHVIFGRHDGLTANGDQYIHRNAPSINQDPQREDRFGRVLTQSR